MDLEGVNGRSIEEGVTGRSKELFRSASASARLRNWRGVKGEPLAEELDFIDCGLPPGVSKEKEGVPLGSGVRGGTIVISGASSKVVELIHFSS